MIFRPPVPPTTPDKLPAALATVRLFAPRATAPLPEIALTAAPLVVVEMSKVPLSTTLLEAAIEPVPDKAKVAPESTVVKPV